MFNRVLRLIHRLQNVVPKSQFLLLLQVEQTFALVELALAILEHLKKKNPLFASLLRGTPHCEGNVLATLLDGRGGQRHVNSKSILQPLRVCLILHQALVDLQFLHVALFPIVVVDEGVLKRYRVLLEHSE